MQNFARRTAPSASNVESKPLNPDDFKIALPKTKLPKSYAPRPATTSAPQPAVTRAPQLDTTSAHHVLATPPATGQLDQHDVFGTDAGSLDDTTTDLHEHPIESEEPHHAKEPWDHSSDLDGLEYGTDGMEDEDEDEDHVPDVIMYRVEGQDHSVSKHIQPDLHSQVAMVISKKKAHPVNPPSYPATTSGEPSIVAPEEDQPYHQDQQYAAVSQLEPITTAQNGAWHKEDLTAAGRQGTWLPGFAVHTQHDQQPQRQQDFRPHAENVYAYERDLPGPSQPQQSHRQEVVVVQRPSNIDTKHNHRNNVNNHRNSSMNVDPDLTTPTKTPASRVDTARGTNNMETESSKPQLDHDEARLFKMNFTALQAEDFDIDPRDSSDGFQNVTGDELNDHIARVSKNHTEQQQKDFFASLSIEQWEQAGDWFQDQFADMFRRMKENRREKRKLAYEFEAKIALRHQTVLKKRQLTEDALSAMKGAGAHVLDTPRKMKQKR